MWACGSMNIRPAAAGNALPLSSASRIAEPLVFLSTSPERQQGHTNPLLIGKWAGSPGPLWCAITLPLLRECRSRSRKKPPQRATAAAFPFCEATAAPHACQPEVDAKRAPSSIEDVPQHDVFHVS